MGHPALQPKRSRSALALLTCSIRIMQFKCCFTMPRKNWGETLTYSTHTCSLSHTHKQTLIHSHTPLYCSHLYCTSTEQHKAVPSPQPEKQKHLPPKHLPPPRHTQTNQAASNVPDRLQTPQPQEETCVCVYLCFTGGQSPVFSPNENPGSGSSETQHTLFGF